MTTRFALNRILAALPSRLVVKRMAVTAILVAASLWVGRGTTGAHSTNMYSPRFHQPDAADCRFPPYPLKTAPSNVFLPPPTNMGSWNNQGQWEHVYWRARLWRQVYPWSQWVLLDDTHPWYRTTVKDVYGTPISSWMAWKPIINGQEYAPVDGDFYFPTKRPGSPTHLPYGGKYAIEELYWWPASGQAPHSQWATFVFNDWTSTLNPRGYRETCVMQAP